MGFEKRAWPNKAAKKIQTQRDRPNTQMGLFSEKLAAALHSSCVTWRTCATTEPLDYASEDTCVLRIADLPAERDYGSQKSWGTSMQRSMQTRRSTGTRCAAGPDDGIDLAAFFTPQSHPAPTDTSHSVQLGHSRYGCALSFSDTSRTLKLTFYTTT